MLGSLVGKKVNLSGETWRTVGRFAENKTLWMDQREMEASILKVCGVKPLQMVNVCAHECVCVYVLCGPDSHDVS